MGPHPEFFPFTLPFSALDPPSSLPCGDLSDGQGGPVDLLSLQGGLSPGLDHVGAEEGPQGPKFCPVGVLIVGWRAQLCQDRGTVFLQRQGKEPPGRGRAGTLRIGMGKG